MDRGGPPGANLEPPRLGIDYVSIVSIVNDGLAEEVVAMAHLVSQPGRAALPPEHMSYLAIADDLAARIAAREDGYRPGQKLPSVTRLVELYSSSRSTVVRAMGLLHDRGLVEGVQGVGVFVRQG